MDFKRVLTGVASEEEARRFWGISLAVGFGMMALSIIQQNHFYSSLGYKPGIDYFLVLAGLGLSLASFLVKPVPPRAVEVALVAVIGMVALGFVFSKIFFGEDSLSIPSTGFVVMAFSALPVIGRVIASGGHAGRTETAGSGSSDFASSVSRRSAVNPDAVLYTAIGGAAAIGLSLLVLPWFALENFDWNNLVNITFNNLRDVYNYIRNNGLDGDVRFLYLEWGYIVSYAAAIFAGVTALRLRDGKSTISIALLNAAIGVTCLVGLWQGVIATALTQLDEDGQVQFGVWLGVIGHIALVVSFVMMRQMMMNRPSALSPPHF